MFIFNNKYLKHVFEQSLIKIEHVDWAKYNNHYINTYNGRFDKEITNINTNATNNVLLGIKQRFQEI